MRPHLTTGIGRLNETGATAVEFAAIAALLFFILFGIVEFGFIFLQEHYVANAAREGVRIGVRANNYDCFNGETEDTCTVDRQTEVVNQVREYLSTFYSGANIIKPVIGDDEDVKRVPDDNVAEQKTLFVTVEVDNFFPPIISALATLIPGTDFELPETISYTASGDYENPEEP
jgi:hypothetical protein